KGLQQPFGLQPCEQCGVGRTQSALAIGDKTALAGAGERHGHLLQAAAHLAERACIEAVGFRCIAYDAAEAIGTEIAGPRRAQAKPAEAERHVVAAAWADDQAVGKNLAAEHRRMVET